MSAVHSADEILRHAAEWAWLPRNADLSQENLQLVRYPQRLGGGVRGSRVDSILDPGEIIDFAIGRVREWEATRLTIWVGDADSPNLEDELRRRGAVHDDTVTIFARPIDADEIRLPVGVAAEIVRSLEHVRGVDTINVSVWQQTALDEAGLRDELKEVSDELRSGAGARVLATLDGRAASTGGVTIVDGFARLWGAATLEGFRGRGTYRAVLAERLRYAAAHGARTAIVKGRVATSAPILERCGFVRYGEERAYRLDALIEPAE
ncbi:GNAT superfamily N-acetyltransferase [Microbacterium keratanolyticum]|uniref:N-acetyltransferase domain-containing protein n=1 Tax=Microbacterium keratanolyticum TaxID=67574 RepID=A0A9W6M7F7_9MICO|nr:hypothetical protein [Microbacterium keratanolyticum]MBM7468293.1 GNAT superfamily N-acetyltransferase [Microbacterium keratanolyticum]GLK00367.1 hypothetical protein GCM10017596_00820 [Microbacterium keratanolyticum]